MKFAPMLKKYAAPNIPYIIIFVIALQVVSRFDWIPFNDIPVAFVATVLIRISVAVKGHNAKKFRKDIEYGSARFGTSADIKPFMDTNPENNIILTQSEGLTMNPRPANPKYARNKNMLVIGGSGSGKTRFVLKPNLMQCRSKTYPVSFVVTDPKGSILVECGKMLRRYGYKIKVLNTINFKKSMHYNALPLLYKGAKANSLPKYRTVHHLRHKWDKNHHGYVATLERSPV